MTDRVHPAAKTTTPKPTFPAAQSNLPGATRLSYRPQPPHRRRSRSGCSLCCWLLLILLFLLLLLGGGATVFYFLYHPQRPTFSLTSLKLTTFNLTSPSTLDAKFHLALSTTNPNPKILFSYDATSVSILCGDTALAAATIPAFRQPQRNTTVLEATVASTEDAVAQLKRSKSEVALKVELETKVAAETGVLTTPRVGVRVLCDGIGVSLPDGEKPATAITENTECEVDVRLKVWKWTIG
ncbi:NDR1/HIN1-like protein 10 [Cajanus cajan]|uniref:Late embryogenesis abundant protein LEA-2 subgroup domain-containing protein n=1 Tax=Cajanus cajan TaxID=3821 RepID=A0A151SHR2_CAJCA|nr:NDR1/HIN1-like protein 10 [Cajanus cajan]KYP54332.1 hypothetical protein KK1_000517 [Cajanus cajan]